MNVAVDPRALRPAEPVGRRGRLSRFLLGMPELCLGGLSETWLLKACGDLHWRLIADCAGRDLPEFRDAGGRKAYAAFCALRSASLRLDAFGEHDVLELHSEIAAVSRTRFASRHVLRRRGEAAGVVELLSTFVTRGASTGNRSIAKVTAAGLPAEGRDAPWPVCGLPNRLRKDRWDAHRGFRRESAAERGSYAIRPCPTQDFNGAELLYFVSYSAFADRAEWDLLDLPAAGVATRAREVVFHGNLDPGERIIVALRGVKRSPAGLGHWIQVSGAADGRLLAEIFTMKAIAAASR